MATKSKRRAVRTSPATKKRITDSRQPNASTAAPKSKLDAMAAALRGAKGATLADLMALTGWQQHSVRGALAGALKKRGLSIVSTKIDAERVYRIAPSK